MAIDPKRETMVEEQPPTGPVHDPLSFIRPRQKAPISEVHRRMMIVLRRALPIVAALILLALIIWPMIDTNKITAMAVSNIPDLVIQNLHLTGTDSKNEPYSLMALKTTRPSGSQSIYDLDKPEGEITMQSGAWIAGKALYGRYDQDTRHLWLGGNVELFHDKGSEFMTDEAQINLNDNSAWGERPVLIHGGFGQIRGTGFEVLDSGKVIVVKGPAHASLDLHPSAPSDKPASTVH